MSGRKRRKANEKVSLSKKDKEFLKRIGGSKGMRRLGGNDYIFSGYTHTTKQGAKKTANKLRTEQNKNARVVPSKRQGKKRLWNVYERPKALKGNLR